VKSADFRFVISVHVIFDPSDNVAIVKDVVGRMTASPAALLPWYWDEFDSFPVADRQVGRPNRPSRGGPWQILFQSLTALHRGQVQMCRARNRRTSASPSRSLNIGNGIDGVRKCLRVSARSRDVPAYHVFPTTIVPSDYERCPMHLPRSGDTISWRLVYLFAMPACGVKEILLWV
jgi:hypothetical protein